MMNEQGELKMKPLPLAAMLVFVLMQTGCSPPDRNEAGSIHEDASQTKVDLGGGKGLKIDAPNADVQIGGGKGIQVDTPDTHIDLGGDQ